MPVEPIIEHGVKPEYDLADETGMAVTKVSIKPIREFVERKGANKMIAYVRGENPSMTFDISGSIIPDSSGNVQGLADEHPGNAIALANFTGAASVHGFDAADNKLIILKDATRDMTDEEEPQVQINAQLYPGITAA